MSDIKKWFPHGTGTDNTGKLKVFCFYFAGGSSSVFRSWITATESIDFIPVELPGRGIRISEPHIVDVKHLVNELIPLLYKITQESPFSLYGHSLGAMVAFQLAWELQERRLKTPELLIVAGRHAPNQPDPSALHSDMSDEEMIEELRNLNGTPKEILDNKNIIRFMIPMIRSDLKLHESFTYVGQKLKAPIVAHCGDCDHDANKMMMNYWQDMTTENFALEEFKGDHFFIQSLGIQYVAKIIDTLTYKVDAIQSS